MADQEEITVAIEPDVVVDAGDGGTTDPVADLAAQYKELEERDKRSQERAAQAERTAAVERDRAERAERDAHTARKESVESQAGNIDAGIAAASAEAEAAKRDLRAARDSGDIDKETDAIDRLTAAKAKALRFDEAKSDLEVRRAAPERQQEPRREAPATGDPVDNVISGHTPATQAWLRSHPQYARSYATYKLSPQSASTEDARRARKLGAAHEDALAEGFTVDTPEYFGHVEKFVGIRGADAATQTNGSATNGNGSSATTNNQLKRKMAVPVAPVQQSGGGTTGGRPEVRLSRTEAAAATDGTHVWNYDDPSPQKRFRKGEPIGVQEFARRKHEMTKQGLYDRSFVEQ